MIYELSPNYVPSFPFASESGGHVPQLLWECSPCLRRLKYKKLQLVIEFGMYSRSAEVIGGGTIEALRRVPHLNLAP